MRADETGKGWKGDPAWRLLLGGKTRGSLWSLALAASCSYPRVACPVLVCHLLVPSPASLTHLFQRRPTFFSPRLLPVLLLQLLSLPHLPLSCTANICRRPCWLSPPGWLARRWVMVPSWL